MIKGYLRRFKSVTCVTFASLMLSGCAPQFFIGDVASTIATKKTISDHAVSYFSNKDCSSVRLEQGKTYCVEDDPNHFYNAASKTNCYRELGNVTCYMQEDVYSVRDGIEDRSEPRNPNQPSQSR